jgi:hypothetical protein
MVQRYVFYSAIMGGVLAFILFAVSAFSIPLIYDRRADLVSGVVASVRAGVRPLRGDDDLGLPAGHGDHHQPSSLPLLLVTLPVMAYASRELYFRVFPA